MVLWLIKQILIYKHDAYLATLYNPDQNMLQIVGKSNVIGNLLRFFPLKEKYKYKRKNTYRIYNKKCNKPI